MEGEHVTTKISTPTLSSMKRSQLQKLCKKYGLKANGKNTDLQIKLQQYATNSGEDIDMEDIEMTRTPDIDKSSQRNQYANSISEPTTPRTPSVIPLEQQNKVGSSLVDDLPINMETSQHEIRGNEISSESLEGNLASINTVYTKNVILDNVTKSKEDEKDVNIKNVDHITNNQVTVPDEKIDLNPILLNSTFEHTEMNVLDNMIEPREDETKSVNVKNVDHITNNQDEKIDLNPIPLKPAFEQVEINVSDNMIEPKGDEMEDVNITNVDHIANNQITDHLVSNEKIDLNPIPLKSAFEQVEINVLDNMIEPKGDEMEDVNITNVDHIANNQITDHLVSNEKIGLNPIPLKPTFEQVEINDDMTESKEDDMRDVNITNVGHITNNQITEHLVSGEKADLNPTFLKFTFEQVKMNDNMTESKEDETKDANVDHIANNQITDHLVSDEGTEQVEINDTSLSKKDIIDSVHKELETRFAILKALPSPERKKILENSKIPTATPLRRNSEASMIKQTSPSSTNRFAQAHEKAFLQMPSIVTHYAAHKPKKVEENQDEINKKRKDLNSIQPLIKKQKLAHNTQGNQVIKAAKDVYKKDEVVKPAVKKASRSSIRLKNIFPNPEEQKKKEREEFEKRKQAARSVAQPVLEKVKNRKKSKENVEQKQSSRNIKKSILPRRVQQ